MITIPEIVPNDDGEKPKQYKKREKSTITCRKYLEVGDEESVLDPLESQSVLRSV